MEDNSTWRKVICLKYGVGDGGWFSNCPKGSYGVGLWKHIRKEVVQMQNQCYFVVGDGKKDLFLGRPLVQWYSPMLVLSLSLNWPGPNVLEWLISGLTETRNSILVDTSMIRRWILFNSFWVRSSRSP